MNYQAIIDRYYPAGSRLRDIFISHSRSVAGLALEIAHRCHLPLADEEIETAAMLHDIGIFMTHAPSIACNGSEPYIAHGIIGASLLRSLGPKWEPYARVAERHTGSGLTATEIRRQHLPLPERDFLPETLLEKLICYADKFYSKSGDMKRKPLTEVRAALSTKSEDAARRFDLLSAMFGSKSRSEIKIAFVGLGRRGLATLRRHLILNDVRITALCDTSPETLTEAASVAEAGGHSPVCFSSWEDMLSSTQSVDLVYISTDWASHAAISVAAMESGRDVAVEVPVATCREEAERVVAAAAQTGRFFTMVENCCYDPFHLYTMALVKSGVLGEITHMEGAYIHDLRDEIAHSLWQSMAARNNPANPYPTHGLGPMCQLIDVGREGGDELAEVVSMGPSRVSGINTCLISTRLGRTMLLQYDVSTPRPYSRIQSVCATSGYIAKYPVMQLMIDGMDRPLEGESLDCRMAQTRHPLLEKYETDGLRLGVSNMMNYIMDRRIIDLLKDGEEPDITASDAALWSSLAWLSRQSLQEGSRPVAIEPFSLYKKM
ncbi:MAG: Gfo/Idh/MocA family oxidoreductase [Pseudoflavonifractor sp.]|nr:Gfo/Idh/MocA family oxidoreductase [Alloprevotella sp.]MCM1117016.1 Gfo/Idh/MocA family oxidoreductase [Pseudoflavonifractor sp.]